MLKKLSLLLIFVVSFSCVSTADKENFSLKENEGAVICKISSPNIDTFSLRLANSHGFAPTVKVRKDDPVKVFILKEDEYRFYGIEIGNMWSGTQSAVFILPDRFKVEAGKVNYVGDFVYQTRKEGKQLIIETDHFNNEESSMKEALAEIPALLDYEFVSIY